VRPITASRDVDRVVTKADRVANDAPARHRRLNRSTRGVGPTVRELRRAARALHGTVSP
jgi:hypothetical protein